MSNLQKTEEKKKRKKYKLAFHENQVFVDSSDALFVWKYDPLTPKKIILGVIVMLGIIGVTLFPLWPPSVRVGVYYLSICGGIFVGLILFIAAGKCGCSGSLARQKLFSRKKLVWN